jgi:gluconolactonase
VWQQPRPLRRQVVPDRRLRFQGNATLARLWHGDVNGKPILWAEGPAWSSQGQYLLFSDIPNSRQLRWLEDDGHVSVFRQPTGNSNGNTF